VICLSVCLPLCLSVSCAETAEPIKVPFGAWIRGAESTMYLTEARIPHGKWYFWGIILGHAPTCLRSIFSTITSAQMTLSSFFPVLFTPSLTTATLYHNLPKSQITRLQQIQNSLARAVVKAPKSSRITPILRSLHWLKITERIEYKLLSLTYEVLTTTQPSYLHNLITVQPPRSTRSSSLVTLARPSTSSSL